MAARLRLFSPLLLSFLFLLAQVAVFAQESPISVKASTDKEKFAQDQPVTFQIEISGKFNSSPQIELPDFKKDFAIISTAQTLSLNIKGKEKSRQTTFIYVLAAKSQGKLTIPPALVKIGKQVFKTQEIALEVTPPEKSLPSEPPEEIPEDSEQEQFII